MHLIGFSTAMGILGVAITLSAYAILICAIMWKGKRPSPIAWFGFGLCTGVGYLVQVYAGLGAGSWTMGVTAFFCFIVAGLSVWKSGFKADRLDWASLVLGFATFLAWLVCYLGKFNQNLAAVLATASDLILYIPLIRQDWSHPESDSRTAYFLNTIKFVPTLIVTAPFSLATALYPLALVCANSGMNIYLGLRKSWLDGGMNLLYRVLFIESEPGRPKSFERYQLVMPAVESIALAIFVPGAGLIIFLVWRGLPADTAIGGLGSILLLITGGFVSLMSDCMIREIPKSAFKVPPPPKPGWGTQAGIAVGMWVAGMVLIFCQVPEMADGTIAEVARHHPLSTILFATGWIIIFASMLVYVTAPNDPLKMSEWPVGGPH